MERDFKIKVDLGKVILIGDEYSKIDYECKIYTKWAIFKEKPDKVYCLEPYELRKYYKSSTYEQLVRYDYKIINLKELINNKIQLIIEKEMEKYISEHINNIEYITGFTERSYYNSSKKAEEKYKTYDFIRYADRFGVNVRDDMEEINKYYIEINDIAEGKVKLVSNEYHKNCFEYDIEQDKFNVSDEEILKTIYGTQKLKMILAYEQYKKGITPLIYNEIAKINEFIRDKKTVTIELHNGTKFKTEAALYLILDIRKNGEIFIADSYHHKILEGEKQSYDNKYLGSQLKSIKYGKLTLDINSEEIKILKDTSEDKNLENKEKKIMNKYESVIIMKPDLDEEERKNVLDKYTKLLKDFSTREVNVEDLGKKKLAYEIKGYKEGCYAVYSFYGQSENISQLERHYRLDDNVIKFMTVIQEERVYDQNDEENEEEY